MIVLERTPLLIEGDQYVGGDRYLRRSERDLSPVSADDHRAHAARLRRYGNNDDANHHELHALGLDRAAAFDEHHRLRREADQLRERLHRLRRTGASHADRQAARDDEIEARTKARRAYADFADADNAWYMRARPIHRNGRTTLDTLHRPQTQDELDHIEHILRYVDGLGDVHHTTLDRNGVNAIPSESVRFRAYGGSEAERRQRVTNAANLAHAALSHHYPNRNVRHGDPHKMPTDYMGPSRIVHFA